MKACAYQYLPLENLSDLNFISGDVLDKGSREMQKHKVVFLGITRDNAPDLPMTMRHIEEIGKYFKDYRVIVFENDSKDGTKLILKLWKHVNRKVKIISENFYNKKRPSIQFLAQLRNKCLATLSEAAYDDFDIIILIDMDMKFGIDIRGIVHSFNVIDQWDMVCSNGIFNSRGQMYDAFAFRNSEFPYSPKEFYAKFNDDYERKCMPNIQKAYSPQSQLVPVESCFGGLAIYKRNIFKGCQYDLQVDDCEHVYLHKCMRKKHKARMFMNPAQLIKYRHYKVIN